MAFDPSEPRDPHSGKWIKIAKALKGFQQGGYHYDSGSTHEKIVRSALQELPKGGKGNLTKLNGVEIRRHQTGSFAVKINGESRHYTSHEDAASAVIAKKHNAGGTLKAGGHATTPVGQAAASKPTFVLPEDMQTLKDQAKKLEEILAHKSLSNKLGGKGAPNDPATKKQELHLQAIYDKMAQIQQTKSSAPSEGGWSPGALPGHVKIKAQHLTAGDQIHIFGKDQKILGKKETAGGNVQLSIQDDKGMKATQLLEPDQKVDKKVGATPLATPKESGAQLTASQKLMSHAELTDPNKHGSVAWEYEKGLITANEYHTLTGEHPHDEAGGATEAGPAKPSVSAPKTPYTDANHLMVKKGDVVKLNGQHWQVTGKTSVTGNPSAKELHLQNAQGGTTTKILSGSATIEKSNTPEKFVPYVGPKAHAVPAYDPAKELPAGALKGPQAWSAIPQYSPKTQEERKAIKGYTNGEYGSMNAGLRKGLMTAQVEKLVEGLDAAFKHPTILTHEVVVHRGFSNQDSILGNLGSHIGGVFIDHGFISTSTNEGTASSFGGGAIVDIILPKGAGVIKAGTNSSHQSESEIILNRGSKFRIISDKMVSTGGVYGGQKRRVVVRLVV